MTKVLLESIKASIIALSTPKRKGFEMPISAVIAIVLGVLFVAAYWTAASGYFEMGVDHATELAEGVN